MNNTHALLLAFIEASGYEVEEVERHNSMAFNLCTKQHKECAAQHKAMGVPFYETYPVRGDFSEYEVKVTKKASPYIPSSPKSRH